MLMNIPHPNSYLVNTNGFGADVVRKFFDKDYHSTREMLEAHIHNVERQINTLNEDYHESDKRAMQMIHKINDEWMEIYRGFIERFAEIEQKIERMRKRNELKQP